MENEWVDPILEKLKERREELNVQIKRLDTVITTLQELKTRTQTKGKRKDSPKWSYLIDQLFENEQPPLTITDIIIKLRKDLGVKEAIDPDYRASIVACLSRKVQQEKSLTRSKSGHFNKVRKTPCA